MFPCFSLLNAASFSWSMATQFWPGAVIALTGCVACLFFALAVERMEDGNG